MPKRIDSDSENSVVHVSFSKTTYLHTESYLNDVYSAFKSFTSDKGSSTSVTKVASRKEAEAKILEENKERCEFFKYYKFAETDKLGTVSSKFVWLIKSI